jgi:hypothetical protein
MLNQIVLLLMLICVVGCGDEELNINLTADTSSITPSADEPISDFAVCTQPLPIEPNEGIDHLIITELSEREYANRKTWYEVFNPTNNDILLSDYIFKFSNSVQAKLPAINLKPNQHAVLFTPFDSVDVAEDHRILTAQLGFLEFEPKNYTPDYLLASSQGEVALVNTNLSEIVDYVIYGSKTTSIHPDSIQWTGSNAPSFIDNNKVIRKVPYKDTNTQSDWAPSEFLTMGGSNQHALCIADADLDDIPDCAEDAKDDNNSDDFCEYFNDMPLYKMGARENIQDIFVEIDIQDRDSLAFHQPSLLRAQQMFADYHGTLPKKLHIDIGTKYSSNYDPQNHNLHTGLNHPGGQALPYTQYIGLITKSLTSLSSTDDYMNASDHKLLHQDIRRYNLFRYAVLGDTYWEDKGGTGCSAITGIASTPGLVMALHQFDIVGCASRQFGWDEIQTQNYGQNTLTVTLVHELGHNLGLRHGGDNNVNEKPNYMSIMNYLYKSLDVQNENDGWSYYKKHTACRMRYDTSYENMLYSFIGPTADIKMDYSYGGNYDIDQTNIDENTGLGWSSGIIVGVDFNCDGNNTDSGYSKQLSPQSNNIISDFNDWGLVTNESRPSRFSNNSSSGSLEISTKPPTISDCPRESI